MAKIDRFFFVSLTFSCAMGFMVQSNGLWKPAFDQNNRYRTWQAALSWRNRAHIISTKLRMSGGEGNELPTIGFLGMGIMGVPMALNLLKAGFKVTVWNRSADKCDECIKAGASTGKSPAEVGIAIHTMNKAY